MNKRDKFSNGIKKIHFVGIKGVGLAPLAIIAKEAGFEVSGSDVSEVFITDGELTDVGITPFIGFSEKNVARADLVISTSAHGGEENVEVKEAKKNNIPVLSHGEALGLFQSGEIFGKKYIGISVAGSHGKTTTSAIVATLLSKSHLDPSFAIGTGQIPSLGSSGHFGKGKYFVAEADEYVMEANEKPIPKFLFQNPQFLIVTNIDFDHPDVYNSVDEIREAFLKFSENVPADGVVIACGDGDENRKFLNQLKTRKITYGLSPGNDFYIEKVNFSAEKMFFWVYSRGTLLGEFSMQVFGEQNALDALSAIILGLEIGLSIDQIRKGISAFKGTKRRSEFIGNLPGGGLLYDDYAHHPEEIKKTLSAFRKSFPKHKIIPIFQPHMYSRTKKLFNEFSSSFYDADEVLICEIFPSFREKNDPNFSSSLLIEEIKKLGKNASYFPTLSDVVKYVPPRNFDKNTVIITMGAGDVYKIGKELINSNKFEAQISKS